MRSLYESLFDIDDNIDNVDKSIKDQIKQFLNDNFTNVSKCKISEKPNKDGKFEVSSNSDVRVKNEQITSLTNGSFIWTYIKGEFNCFNCKSLISLEGAPKEVGGDFDCSYCKSLISLEGASEKVGGDFYCNYCDSLKSLEGAPKEVSGDFSCSWCNLLKSLEGAPKKVGRSFYCNNCNSLISLEGAPKEVRGEFNCAKCGRYFTQEDVEKVSNVKGIIYV